MKLRLSRSQKQHGMVSKGITFCLDARAELTPEEAADVKKYKLGKEVVYNSAATQKRIDQAYEQTRTRKFFDLIKSISNVALSRLSLHITIDSLTKGHHIEAHSLEELLDAEEKIQHACENLRIYLAAAATFDGREQVVEF